MNKIKVFYDGACNACSTSILKYHKKQRQLQPIDMSKDSFNAKKHKLNPKRIRKVLHVRLSSGKIVTGIDALIVLWKKIPGYGWIAKLSLIFYPFAWLVYRIFAKLRH